MQNVYQDLMADMRYNKFVVDELLFVEYNCPITSDVWSVWTETDFIMHVLQGKKRLFSGENEWMVTAGDTIYIQKGAFSMNQYFDDEFCMIGLFVNDDFIRTTLSEHKSKFLSLSSPENADFGIKRVASDSILEGFFASIYPYFKTPDYPAESILELKLKEIILHLISAGLNPQLAAYFASIATNPNPSINSIMESNFCHNASLEEYAKMCHRSLSSFKREFKEIYDTSPGKWLLKKRLVHANHLLRNPKLSVAEVAYESGFENPSHFSRTFKNEFGISPQKHRETVSH